MMRRRRKPALTKTTGRALPQRHLTLDLPIRGRWYRIEHPSKSRAVVVAAVVAAAMDRPAAFAAEQLQLDGVASDEAVEALLGDNYGRMLLDGVPPEVIEHAAGTVIAWLVLGTDKAIYHWERWHPENPVNAFIEREN